MKTVFSFMALLCAFMSQAQGLVYVGLGKSNSCEGFGLCRMELTASPGFPNLIPCQINVLKGGKLRMAFSKKSLKDADYLKHFATGYFYVEEEVPIPPEICKQLNLSNGLLRKGKYAVFDEGELICFIL